MCLYTISTYKYTVNCTALSGQSQVFRLLQIKFTVQKQLVTTMTMTSGATHAEIISILMRIYEQMAYFSFAHGSCSSERDLANCVRINPSLILRNQWKRTSMHVRTAVGLSQLRWVCPSALTTYLNAFPFPADQVWNLYHCLKWNHKLVYMCTCKHAVISGKISINTCSCEELHFQGGHWPVNLTAYSVWSFRVPLVTRYIFYGF